MVNSVLTIKVTINNLQSCTLAGIFFTIKITLNKVHILNSNSSVCCNNGHRTGVSEVCTVDDDALVDRYVFRNVCKEGDGLTCLCCCKRVCERTVRNAANLSSGNISTLNAGSTQAGIKQSDINFTRRRRRQRTICFVFAGTDCTPKTVRIGSGHVVGTFEGQIVVCACVAYNYGNECFNFRIFNGKRTVFSIGICTDTIAFKIHFTFGNGCAGGSTQADTILAVGNRATTDSNTCNILYLKQRMHAGSSTADDLQILVTAGIRFHCSGSFISTGKSTIFNGNIACVASSRYAVTKVDASISSNVGCIKLNILDDQTCSCISLALTVYRDGTGELLVARSGIRSAVNRNLNIRLLNNSNIFRNVCKKLDNVAIVCSINSFLERSILLSVKFGNVCVNNLIACITGEPRIVFISYAICRKRIITSEFNSPRVTRTATGNRSIQGTIIRNNVDIYVFKRKLTAGCIIFDVNTDDSITGYVFNRNGRTLQGTNQIDHIGSGNVFYYHSLSARLTERNDILQIVSRTIFNGNGIACSRSLAIYNRTGLICTLKRTAVKSNVGNCRSVQINRLFVSRSNLCIGKRKITAACIQRNFAGEGISITVNGNVHTALLSKSKYFCTILQKSDSVVACSFIGFRHSCLQSSIFRVADLSDVCRFGNDRCVVQSDIVHVIVSMCCVIVRFILFDDYARSVAGTIYRTIDENNIRLCGKCVQRQTCSHHEHDHRQADNALAEFQNSFHSSDFLS